MLLSDGRMHESGAAAVIAAKADGSWSLLDLAEDLVIPKDLEQALAGNPEARAGFDEYPSAHANRSCSGTTPRVWSRRDVGAVRR